jgi:hypothetical protein
MQESINFSVTPFQAILALAFQVWIVVFPIMLMRRIDRLTNLLEDHIGGAPEEEEPGQEAGDGNEEA